VVGKVWVWTLSVPVHQSHGGYSGVNAAAMTLPPGRKKMSIPDSVFMKLPDDL